MISDKRMRRSGATIRHGAGRLLVIAGALAAAWSALTILSGGFALHTGVIALSSRDPLRPLIVAAILVAGGRRLLPGAEFGRAVALLTGDRTQLPPRIAGAVALPVLIFSTAWNPRPAVGSDSSRSVLPPCAFASARSA